MPAARNILTGTLKASRIERTLKDYGFVSIGPGEHYIDEVIQVGNQSNIQGAGEFVSKIIWRGDGPAFNLAGYQTGSTTGGEISNMRVQGMGDGSYANAVSGSAGFRVGQNSGSPASAQYHLRDVTISGFEIGLDLKASVIGRYTNVLTRQCTTGLSTDTTHRSIHNVFSACRWERNLLGMRLGNCEELLFLGCIWQYNYGRAMWIGQQANGLSCQGIKFEQPYFEGNCVTTDQSGTGCVLVDSAYASTTRSIEFSNALHSGNDSDYDYDIGANEGVILSGWQYTVAPTVIAPTSGTPARTWSPLRAAREYFNRGSDGLGFNYRYTADDGDATPNVHKGDTTVIDYSGVSVTDITGFGTFNLTAEDGHRCRVEVHCAPYIRFVDGTSAGNCNMANGNWTPPDNCALEFELVGGVWVEQWRGWLGGSGGSGSPYP